MKGNLPVRGTGFESDWLPNLNRSQVCKQRTSALEAESFPSSDPQHWSEEISVCVAYIQHPGAVLE